MSKVFYSIGVFIVFFLIALFVFLNFSSKQDSSTTQTTTTTKTSQPASTPASTAFHWGGTFYPAFDWSEPVLDQQMALLRKNKINIIRSVYIPESSPDSILSDKIMAAAKKNNVAVVLILEPEKTTYTDATINYKKTGADLADEAIKRFGNQVDYYQLINEVGGTALKSGDGQSASSFDLVKYAHIRDTITGMSTTISQLDPTAKTIVSNQWLHYGMLDLLAKDKVKFDIIGWNWFPEGIDMDKVEYAPGKTINMLQKLKSYNKPVWLTEFNRDHGSNGKNGDAAQAAFLKEKLQKYYDSGVFSAIFIHELFDKPNEGSEKDRHWGIIKLVPPNKFEGKPALKVYTDFIASHS